ncbi:GNAT family N-acetyltransferase [Sediminispirochaeta bajacaliforniensis]|uniref:GNAT family N-acetyltransferase n=1 Tax=Sediminispirochaeta bajacaliforniensis TaxID=148 RepID=UPI000377A6A4|nr:GNAT family N-acetyltransferase [Sediminispirochaeta bajacaliforniensis]
MKLVDCGRSFASLILDIYNEAIIHSTALYDYKPRTIESMETWFADKEKKGFPIIGLVDEKNRLIGFGTYGNFRARPAYHYTVEHSIYVQKEYRGCGYGEILLREIIAKATEQDYHCLIAGIDSENAASIHLHKKLGFSLCGELKQVGYKFGRWLNLVFYQLILPTPQKPQREI